MTTSLYQRYAEHPAVALSSVLPHLTRVGASLSGIGGNDLHTFGYHLSQVRLRATGMATDYSLQGDANTPVVDAHAACAIDIGMDWPAARAWLEWVRAERAAGRLGHVAELIGSTDGRTARYAAATSGWLWERYEGTGHVDWCHVAVGRRWANDDGFGDALLAGWSATGREDEDMAQVSQAQWDRARAQLDAIADTVTGGKGTAYDGSVMRRDHGYQIDELDRRVKAYVDQRLIPIETKLGQILAALQPPAAG